MFELILNVFINRYASGGSSTLAGESNQGTVENSISHEEVVKDSSILGSTTNIKKKLTAKEKKRLRDQKYRQKKATCAPVVGRDTKTYLTPVEKKRLRQKKYRERKSASAEFQQRERARVNRYYSDPTNSQKKRKNMQEHFAIEENAQKQRIRMQNYFAVEENAHRHREDMRGRMREHFAVEENS